MNLSEEPTPTWNIMCCYNLLYNPTNGLPCLPWLPRTGNSLIILVYPDTVHSLRCMIPTCLSLLVSFMPQNGLFQKLVPDNSEVVKTKAPRPLPKDRTRIVANSSEVDTKKGLLTQTQLAAFLER